MLEGGVDTVDGPGRPRASGRTVRCQTACRLRLKARVGAALTGDHRPCRPSLELTVAAVGGSVGHLGGGSPQLSRHTEAVLDLKPDRPSMTTRCPALSTASRSTRRRESSQLPNSSAAIRRSGVSTQMGRRTTIGWLMHHRRLIRDYEARLDNSVSMITLTMIDNLAKRFTTETIPTWRQSITPHNTQNM